MLNWYPVAKRNVPGNAGGTFLPNSPMRGVLHTTEGSSVDGAFAAYRNNNSWPHFTVGKDGMVFQHVALDRAARALKNLSGGVETNRQGAIQVEVVGSAVSPVWPPAQVQAMIFLMRWIECQTGILPQGPEFGSWEQYGYKNPLEFSYLDWNHFNGWCGHQHVPENTHWDPGHIDLSILLPQETPVPDTFRVNAPAVAFLLSATGNGYGVLCADGGIFSFGDFPVLTQYGRVEYVIPAGNDWTPAA